MSAGIVSEVVLVGRDAPVWLAACVLQQALAPAGVKITVVELPSRLHAADAYATLPALEPLHTRLKIDESKLIGVTRGAFTLGKRFVDTSGLRTARSSTPTVRTVRASSARNFCRAGSERASSVWRWRWRTSA